MDIRPITTENVDDCLDAFMQAYNCPPWNCHWTAEKAKQYLAEYMSTPHFTGFLLYHEGEVIGATMAHQKTWWTNRQLFIDEFFISPTKQRMGYGKALMDYCVNYASENDLGVVVLMTNKYMPSFKFYNKIEYITTEQFVFMFKQVL